MTDNQQPRIPGVRYRKVERTRWVPTTIGGETRLTPEEYTEWEPVPPRDLDVLYLRVVIGVAVAMTTIAVVWSTAAIGGLLSHLVLPVIAYGAASAFESVWIVCLVVKWLMRHDPKRARVAGVAGWIGLAVVVASVTAHGFDIGQEVAGLVGGGVSIMAKGTWTVVLRLFSVPLGQGAAAFLQQKREELTVSRVVLGEQQRLNGQAAYLAAVYGPAAVAQAPALQQLPAVPLVSGQASAVSAPAVPAMSGQVSVQVPPPPVPPVLPVSGQAPAVSAPAVPPVSGQASAPVPPVSVPDLAKVPVPPVPPVPNPAEAAPTPPQPQLQAVDGSPSIAGAIRTVLAAEPDISDEELTDRVRAATGDRKNLADTVRRTRSRIQRKAS